jgi:hypothetical protein
MPDWRRNTVMLPSARGNPSRPIHPSPERGAGGRPWRGLGGSGVIVTRLAGRGPPARAVQIFRGRCIGPGAGLHYRDGTKDLRWPNNEGQTCRRGPALPPDPLPGRTSAALTDAELLERFLSRRDERAESAFAIVGRRWRRRRPGRRGAPGRGRPRGRLRRANRGPGRQRFRLRRRRPAGRGGAGGNAFGGGIGVDVAATLTITDSNVTGNLAQAGFGGSAGVGGNNGAVGQGLGGGIYLALPGSQRTNTTTSTARSPQTPTGGSRGRPCETVSSGRIVAM